MRIVIEVPDKCKELGEALSEMATVVRGSIESAAKRGRLPLHHCAKAGKRRKRRRQTAQPSGGAVQPDEGARQHGPA